MKDDVHKYPQDSMNSFSMLCILRKAMFRQHDDRKKKGAKRQIMDNKAKHRKLTI
jgi:hypothetical protein